MSENGDEGEVDKYIVPFALINLVVKMSSNDTGVGNPRIWLLRYYIKLSLKYKKYPALIFVVQ